MGGQALRTHTPAEGDDGLARTWFGGLLVAPLGLSNRATRVQFPSESLGLGALCETAEGRTGNQSSTPPSVLQGVIRGCGIVAVL
jgi:hypothetical protein